MKALKDEREDRPKWEKFTYLFILSLPIFFPAESWYHLGHSIHFYCQRKALNVLLPTFLERGFPDISVVKNLSANAGDAGLMLQDLTLQSQEDPLEEEIAIHSIILAWEIPWTEVSGGL